jgi:hypothetical protein
MRNNRGTRRELETSHLPITAHLGNERRGQLTGNTHGKTTTTHANSGNKYFPKKDAFLIIVTRIDAWQKLQ